MKTIYFVRHGETEINVHGLVHSHPSNRLTEKGRQQAEYIAERCSTLPLQLLVSSTYTRAEETAECISKKNGLELEKSDLFVECRFISKYWDKPRTEESRQAIKLIGEKWGTPGFRVDDEENFKDVIRRAGAALEFLSHKSEEHIGVVTHGLFLRNLVARALFGASLTPKESNVFAYSLDMANTGLTVFHYNEKEIERPWKLWIWNDHAHLG